MSSGKELRSILAKPSVENSVCHHLAALVLPKQGIKLRFPDFERIALNKQKTVYLYRENKSGSCLVCKFFGSRHELSPLKRKESLRHEFSSLHALRKMGFCEYPHRAVRPIDKNEKINCMLVEDFARGCNLDHFIKKAAYEGQNEPLKKRLTILVQFLAQLHEKGPRGMCVDFKYVSEYMRNIRHELVADGIMSLEAAFELGQLCGGWERDHIMQEDRSVLIHGDVTPTNFIFHPEDGLTAIDVERMRFADPVYDLGFLAAELKHHFALRILKADAAEPFIAHFFRAYCEKFPDPGSVFSAITHRNRFYMALGELRIARNIWLPLGHRKWLVEEAFRCLRH